LATTGVYAYEKAQTFVRMNECRAQRTAAALQETRERLDEKIRDLSLLIDRVRGHDFLLWLEHTIREAKIQHLALFDSLRHGTLLAMGPHLSAQTMQMVLYDHD
jgi:hypothetical protein